METENHAEQPELIQEILEQPTEEVGQQQSQSTEKVRESSDEKELNWRSAREIMAHQKEELDYWRNYALNLQKPQKEAPQKDELESLSDEDIITVKDFKRIAKKYEERLEQVQRSTAEERFASKNPDYQDVVTAYIPKLLKEKPSLRSAIQNSDDPYLTAYEFAKAEQFRQQMSQGQPAQQVSVKETRAQKQEGERILKNATRPSSANVANIGLKAEADVFSNLSKQQVWELSQKYASTKR